MQIQCPHCAAQIPAAQINLDRLLATCSQCNAVFSFADQVEGAETIQPVERIDVPMPKGFEVHKMGNRLEITRKWFSPKYIFLTFFTVFWDGFMVMWFGIAITKGVWPMAVFGLLHGGVGVWLLYTVLAGYLNKTVIAVSGRELSITHGPLPWRGNKHLKSSNITQVYCKERIQHGKHSTNYTYEVQAILRGGAHEKLLSGLDESEQALYLEQEIERFLEIEDRPVKGELRK
jgi:predicted Zn finger-like uncharacterized protein